MTKPEIIDAEKPLSRTGYAHIAFTVGSKEKVDELTEQLRADGYEVVSGPRTTGDGYYESFHRRCGHCHVWNAVSQGKMLCNSAYVPS